MVLEASGILKQFWESFKTV